jgi:hypothetical protein
VPFAQAGLGLSVGRSRFSDDRGAVSHDTFLGWQLSGSAGVSWTPWDHWGVVTRIRWQHVPVIDNLIGDTHDAGGVSLLTGVHLEL